MRYGSYENRGYGYGGGWAPYVSVAERRKKAADYARNLEKSRGRALSPVAINGRTIAQSFWGKAWCDNLESYSDFSNRLPRGRTYVRNGSVIDLDIKKGEINALVSGSEIYELKISISTLLESAWQTILKECANSVNSLLDLLQGRFDRAVMERLSQKERGLFPRPREITMSCSCPDSATMCKHVAAVLYGVGARLDRSPELLFTLRNCDPLELISQAAASENLDRVLTGDSSQVLESDNLAAMFGIELDLVPSNPSQPKPKKSSRKAAALMGSAPATPKQTKSVKRPAKKAAASVPDSAAKKKPLSVKDAVQSATSKAVRLKSKAAAKAAEPSKTSVASRSRKSEEPVKETVAPKLSTPRAKRKSAKSK